MSVPTERAYGQPDPTRIQHWARTRFPLDRPLLVGEWVRILNRTGRHRTVRILEVRSQSVVVDTNHRWAGQAMELEVELIRIWRRPSLRRCGNLDGLRSRKTFQGENAMQERLKAVAFDVDPASLITLRQAFPEWEVEAVVGATASSIDRDWNPKVADLLLVGVREGVADTLGLCRALRGQAGRAQTPLLVLIVPDRKCFRTWGCRRAPTAAWFCPSSSRLCWAPWPAHLESTDARAPGGITAARGNGSAATAGRRCRIR